MQAMSLIDTSWGHMGAWGWGMAVFGWVFMALLVASVVWGVAALARTASGSVPSRSALDLLDRRYAQGDIDGDERLLRKKDLDAWP